MGQRIQHKTDGAYILYATETKNRQRAEAKKTALDRELRQAQTDGSDERVSELEARLAKAQADCVNHAARASRALDVFKAGETKMHQLHAAHFGVFAEQADEVSKEAEVALEQLAAAYRHAKKKWQAAVDAWSPLCAAVKIAGVDELPVKEFELLDVLRGEANPRPRSVEIAEVVTVDP